MMCFTRRSNSFNWHVLPVVPFALTDNVCFKTTPEFRFLNTCFALYRTLSNNMRYGSFRLYVCSLITVERNARRTDSNVTCGLPFWRFSCDYIRRRKNTISRSVEKRRHKPVSSTASTVLAIGRTNIPHGLTCVFD